MSDELRRLPRYPFIASAEITEVATQTRMTARTGDLSLSGCYLDMITPLPHGSRVMVRIKHGEQTFGATAGVVFSQPHMGMGLVFHEVETLQELTLRNWLSDLRENQLVVHTRQN